MLGGIVAGQLPAPADPARRLSAQLFGLGLLSIPLALATSPVLMGIALLLAGAMLAPSLALAFGLLAEVSPAGSVTESQTWATTAIGGGLALGAALGGWLIDEAGTTAALTLPAIVAVVAGVVVGGVASVGGALVGAAIVIAGRDWLFGVLPGHAPLVLGVAFVVTVPVNRWLIARGRGHAVVHQYHH